MARLKPASKSGSAALSGKLQQTARRIQPEARYQALVGLYQGSADAAEVFSAIEAPPVSDMPGEAAFFAGGYQQYVRKDAAAALQDLSPWLGAGSSRLGGASVAPASRPVLAAADSLVPSLAPWSS